MKKDGALMALQENFPGIYMNFVLAESLSISSIGSLKYVYLKENVKVNVLQEYSLKRLDNSAHKSPIVFFSKMFLQIQIQVSFSMIDVTFDPRSYDQIK